MVGRLIAVAADIVESTVVVVSLVLSTIVAVDVLGVALALPVEAFVPSLPPRFVAEHLVEVVVSLLEIPSVAAADIGRKDTVQIGSVALVAGLRKLQSGRG